MFREIECQIDADLSHFWSAGAEELEFLALGFQSLHQLSAESVTAGFAGDEHERRASHQELMYRSFSIFVAGSVKSFARRLQHSPDLCGQSRRVHAGVVSWLLQPPEAVTRIESPKQAVSCIVYSNVTIELPSQVEQTAFNLRRWDELLADAEIARIEGRIETDRHGHIIMSPPPAASHGSFQYRIGRLLEDLLQGGRVITECPISTADGVKAADVAWASRECVRELGNRTCFSRSPEICVEVLSPGNTEKEIVEKRNLYFDAGAKEVWVCAAEGAVKFFGPNSSELRRSKICPKFPIRVVLS